MGPKLHARTSHPKITKPDSSSIFNFILSLFGDKNHKDPDNFEIKRSVSNKTWEALEKRRYLLKVIP